MLFKDLLLALRNLWKNKFLSAINVLGLSIGISACLVIFLIASYELSFDKFQKDGDRIFRVYSRFSGAFDGSNRGLSTGAAAAIRDQIPGIESVTNFHNLGATVTVPDQRGGQKVFDHYNKIILAGPDYFQAFDYYEWIAGSAKAAVSEPDRVVLTESRARFYFGDIEPADAIGKEIRYQDSLIVAVSGIVRDVQERTDFDFTDFISFSTIEQSWLKERISLNDWGGTNSSSQVFIKVSPTTPVSNVTAQLQRISEIYKSHNKDANWVMTPQLQAFSDIHFNSELGIFDSSRSVVEKSTIQILMLIALLLLVIASINFINLETAQGSRRAKEVGVRKVMGASRGTLIRRFLTESFILCLTSVVVSVGLALVAVEYFSDYIPDGVVLDITHPMIATFLALCVIVVTLMAGLYPAFIMSSYLPALALKNQAGANRSQTRAALVRQGLTVFQFCFAQILIVGTIATAMQIDFMVNKDLGFSTAVLNVSTPWNDKIEKALTFRNELQRIPEIEALSMNQSPPLSNGWSSTVMKFDNGKDILEHNVYVKGGDTAYTSVYGIKLLAGRNLTPVDTMREYLINETYMRLLGFEHPHDALGKAVNETYTIVGVVNDFHTRSLHAEIAPTVIRYESDAASVAMKLVTGDNNVRQLGPAIAKIEAAWKKIYPDDEFKYSFLDEKIGDFYATEQRVSSLTRVATAIAILISCLGLFGLSSFTVVQRTKEIGVRKVLGASVKSITFLLSRQFLKLVIIAWAMSTPVAYYLIHQWLGNFAYRIDITASIFLASGLASILIAFVTVSIRTVKAAKSDPVKSLRYE